MFLLSKIKSKRMNPRVIILFPGQGSQHSGMLSPWLDMASPKQLDEWNNICQLDLVHIGTTADKTKLTLTHITQPLLALTGLLCWKFVKSLLPDNTQLYFAGHSAGHTAASAAAGILNMTQALSIASARGHIMEKATEHNDGTMAILLSKQPLSLSLVQDWAHKQNCEIGNVNCSQNFVISGIRSQIASLNPLPNTRLMPIAVGGAFHSRYMQSATSGIKNLVDQLTLGNFQNCHLSSNETGLLINHADTWRQEMVSQLLHPVRWDLICQHLNEQLPTGFDICLELAPGNTVLPFTKKSLHSKKFISIKTKADADKIALSLDHLYDVIE